MPWWIWTRDLTQPRQEFRDDRQQKLSASVAVAGVKPPLMVRSAGHRRYLVIDVPAGQESSKD
ncbi:MAG TPA: hypothetical protein VGD69_01790 [Herpetosiphonaceae bacterium]